MTTKHKDIHSHLIDLCMKQDQKAQLKVYNLYAQAMYSTCVWMVKDPMQAEELMQDGFITAFSKIKSFQRQSTFGAWLKRIVINNCIDSLKKNKLKFTDLDDKINNVPEDIEEQIEYDTSSIKNKILELPDGYRVIITLYLIDGFDHEEIAQILNISSSTSRSQYLRAKKKLIELLKQDEYVG